MYNLQLQSENWFNIRNTKALLNRYFVTILKLSAWIVIFDDESYDRGNGMKQPRLHLDKELDAV